LKQYYTAFKVPWHQQRTVCSYPAAAAQLEGASLKKLFTQSVDAHDNGTITYDESGKKVCLTPKL